MKPITTSLLLISGLAAQAQLPPYVASDFGTDEQGYYFIINMNFMGGSNAQAQAVIFDGAGHVAFRKTVFYGSNFRVWPDGRMSYAAGGKHLFMDSTFTVIDTVTTVNGILPDLHDIQVLDNGHYLLLGVENLTMDLSGYPVFQHNNTPGSATAIVESVVIQELDSAKNLLWEWHGADHFDFLDTDTSRLQNPAEVDWTHSNAVEMDMDGNVLLSSRHFNEITKIDRDADTIMWRMGGVRNQFTFVNDPGFFLQHDIRRLPNGHVTLFDNSKPGAHPGRGVEYALDESTLMAMPVWSRAHDPGAYSRAMGNMQRLDNGNTLIGWGALNPDNAVFTVYRPDSTLVCELYFPDTLVSYRSYYFEELPFALHRPVITCTPEGNVFHLTAEPVGTTYLWSTGATSQTIIVTATDTVFVDIPVGSGGTLRSEPFVPGAECLSTGSGAMPREDRPRIWPNPSGAALNVMLGDSGRPVQVELIDALGKVLWRTTSAENTLRLSLGALDAGLYFIRMDGTAHRFIKSADVD